jgi:hypothetical protein
MDFETGQGADLYLRESKIPCKTPDCRRLYERSQSATARYTGETVSTNSAPIDIRKDRLMANLKQSLKD